MAQTLKFDEAVGRTVPQQRRARLQVVSREQSVEEPDDFWPEVSRGLWVAGEQPVDPANTPRRVFFEILLILGGAVLFVLLISLFVQAPPV